MTKPELIKHTWVAEDHFIGDRQRTNFTEPTKVIDEEEWESIEYPPNLKPHEQYTYKLFTKRVCIKRTIKLVRHGEVIEIVELPGYVINSDIAPLRVISAGNKLDIKAITKEVDQLQVGREI